MNDCNFWVNKFTYENLPIPEYTDDELKFYIKKYCCMNKQVWIKIYGELLKAKKEAMSIIAINKIENKHFSRIGKIIINFDGEHLKMPYGLPFDNTPNNNQPYALKIQVLEDKYHIIYEVEGSDWTHVIRLHCIVNEDTLLLILTGICFNIIIKYPMLNIIDEKNESYLKTNANFNGLRTGILIGLGLY